MNMSIVRGSKGVKAADHPYSHGSFVFAVKGKLKIDKFVLKPSSAGKCRPGPGHYSVEFLEDSEYFVCHSSDDKILKS